MNPLKIFSVMAIVVAAPLLAHEGEDHGAPTVSPSSTVAPRTQTSSDDFELVAVLKDDKLVVYLDRYATNEPVENADIELDVGAVKIKPKVLPKGIYEFAAETFIAPGKYSLVFTIVAGETTDLLDAVLEGGADANLLEHSRAWTTWTIWGGAAAFALGVFWIGGRRVRRAQQTRR